MLPDGVASSQAVVSATVDPEKQPKDLLLDYERGGVALNDGSQGLLVKLWTLNVISVNGIQEFRVSAPGSGETVVFSDTGITEAGLAFDQNMRPFFTYVQDEVSKFRWYDPVVSNTIVTALPAGCVTPRCTLDERRPWHSDISDILLAYIRNGNLCIRYQRERYLTEHVLKEVGEGSELVSVGLNRSARIQFRLRKVTMLDGQFTVNESPYLADVVLGLCLRAGIHAKSINVEELYDTQVIGYKINTDDGINKRIDALREMFFFDKSERDKKLYFPRRGREVSARIYYSDLVADDPSALKVVRIQEAELPRIVSVNHLDPAGGFATNKQTAQRRSNLVKAKGNKNKQSEVVLTADQGATAAVVHLKTAWHEQQTYAFATTLKFAAVAPTDVVEVEDKKGNWHRVRITERNEARVIISFEGVQDAGQEVYGSLGVGHSLPSPVSTTPGLIGETLIEILNIPVLRDQDDELGVYVAVCGQSSGWYGTQLLISTDDGANYVDGARIETPATIGETLTDLEQEISAEYPAAQSVDVLVNFALESATFDGILTNKNRCVIGDEVLQFETATLLAMVGTKYSYRLSGLVRGRYATDPEFWPATTRFVLLDSSVEFMQAQQWMLGKTITIKPVSLGLTEDETVPTAYDFTYAASQTEWPVYDVRATRDVSNNVTVAFIGRGRLGIETAPNNSKYFTGYRVKFSDGYSIDTTLQAAVYNAAAVGLTVQVCALNSITGEGPYSTAIAT